MASATVSVWRDCGFTEGTLEVPSKTSSLPTPTFTYELPAIPRASLFSQMSIKAPYEDLYDCSYLKAVFDMNNGDDVTVYGWIDSVECSSDTANSPMTVINWHIDYWRTYAYKASYGAGVVRRRPKGSKEIPPQDFRARYYTSTEMKSLFPASNQWWIIFTFIQNQTVPLFQTALTYICVAAFPVDVARPDFSYSVTGTDAFGTDTITRKCPSFNQVVEGFFDEMVGLNPDALSACFLSPIPPDEFTGSVTLSASGWIVHHPEKSGVLEELGYGCLCRVKYKKTPKYTVERAGTVTDDVDTYAITGFNGELIGTLPWGLNVDSFESRLIIDATAAYIEIRCRGITGTSEGCTFNMPLLQVSVTSNSTSSYVFSGARDADIQNRKEQLVMSTFQSLIPIGKGMGEMAALPQAAGGASMKKVAALASAEAGMDAVTNGVGAMVSQAGKDRSIANQSQRFVMTGTGWDVVDYGQRPRLIKMSMDDYSRVNRLMHIDLYGAEVNEADADCDALIAAGGPLRIENLNVGGSIPTEAKDYLRKRFSQGVRMI